MKKNVFMFSIIIICFIIQTSLLGLFDFFYVMPNLSLIFLVIFAMTSDSLTGGILGFITGYLYDAMIYDVSGIFTLIYFLIGVIIGTINDDMLRENYFVYSAVTGVSTVTIHSLLYLILFFLRFRVGFAAGNLIAMVLEIIINSILVLFMLKLILFLYDKLNIKI